MIWPRGGGAARHPNRKKGSGLKPDIYIIDKGLRPVIIEHEFEPASNVNEEAIGRLQCETTNGIPIEAVIAIKTPSHFKSVNRTMAELQKELRGATDIKYAVYSPQRFPVGDGWLTGSLADVAMAAMSISTPTSKIDECVDIMKSNINEISAIIEKSGESTKKDIASLLWQKENTQTWKIAGLVLANAFIFHDKISGNRNIQTLSKLMILDTIPVTALVSEWNKILSINYYAIFEVAKNIIASVDKQRADEIIKCLLTMTKKITNMGLTTSTDVYGSLIQHMLTDRSTLASFYTRPSSAELLVGLILSTKNDISFREEDLLKIRIGDFACGTGTLLTTLYRRIAFLFESANTRNNMSKIHSKMMRNAIYGLDVLPSAVHLTVSALAQMYADELFDDTHIVKMPFGKKDGVYYIGSLDLIDDQTTLDTAGTLVTATTERRIQHQDLPKFDIIVMNPPFTTNTKSNADRIAMFSFFDTRREAQNAMRDKQKDLFKNTCGDGFAGEATHFLAIADAKLKEGGVIGLVLPSTIAWGSSWMKCRKLLAEKYEDITIVSISANRPSKLSFSFSTGMGEILLVAKKSLSKSLPSMNQNPAAKFVCLHHRPKTQLTAMEMANTISKATDACAIRDSVYRHTPLHLGDIGIGTVMECPLDLNWWWLVNIRDPYLAQFSYKLANGIVQVPGSLNVVKIPITQPGDAFGISHRMIYDKSERSPPPFVVRSFSSSSVYSLIKNNDNNVQKTILTNPDMEAIAKKKATQKEINKVLMTATRVHINCTCNYSSQALLYLYLNKKTLGSRVFPSFLIPAQYEKALAVWGNSTLGIVTFWIHSARQQMAKGNATRTSMTRMPILDFSKLSESQIRKLNAAFDKYSEQTLLPINLLYKDKTRISIDDEVLSVLGIGDSIDEIRLKFCNEPYNRAGRVDHDLDRLAYLQQH